LKGKDISHSYFEIYLARGTVKSKRSPISKFSASFHSALSLLIPYISLSSAHLLVSTSTLSTFGVSIGVKPERE